MRGGDFHEEKIAYFGGGNYTGGLTVTGCSKQWQLAVSVDTIKF